MNNIVIYKYPILESKTQYIDLPWGYKILKFGNKENEMFIWVEVDIEHAIQNVLFEIVGTGYHAPNDVEYIDSVILPDGFVWHLYKQCD